MKRTLEISHALSLPLETVTQAIGILAKRRAGKSYTARRLTEQLLQCGQQVVIVDPKGDTWGIRSSANGKDPGFPVVIIGGERGLHEFGEQEVCKFHEQPPFCWID